VEKDEIISVLLEMADLMEIESENPFRPRSFRAAARALEALPGDFAALLASGRLREVRGVGDSIAKEIEEITAHGESMRHRELVAAVPEGVRSMLAVPGLGPKKVRALWQRLGITGLDLLEAACRDGKVAELAGFAEKSQQKVLEGIQYLRSVSGRFLFAEVEPLVERVLAHLATCAAVQRLEAAGSFRRRMETVKDLDFVASSAAPEAVSAHFLKLDGVADVIAHGSTKTSVRLGSGIAVDLRLVSDEEFPYALCHFTGSREHNTALRALAKEKGLKLNEYGLFRGEDLLRCRDEAEIHAALGLAYMPPELRENRGEVELAAKGPLPDLVEESDLRGVLHVHTTYSDGANSLDEMVEAAKSRGLSYLGVADHSQSAFYAGGLKEKDVLRQHEEIDRLNAKLRGFRIFKGIESDIRADGSLDYPPEVLDRFDFVVASLHSSLSQPREEMTQRVLRALSDPHTTILGHATGRLLLRREGVALDLDRVLEAAAAEGVAVEINANPQRLELDWRYGPRARELGVVTSINPDAHSTAGIADMRYGVGIARKAGFGPLSVLNAWSAEEFAEFIGRRKKPHGKPRGV
jgi:DNA polymerase (family 10)